MLRQSSAPVTKGATPLSKSPRPQAELLKNPFYKSINSSQVKLILPPPPNPNLKISSEHSNSHT